MANLSAKNAVKCTYASLTKTDPVILKNQVDFLTLLQCGLARNVCKS